LELELACERLKSELFRDLLAADDDGNVPPMVADLPPAADRDKVIAVTTAALPLAEDGAASSKVKVTKPAAETLALKLVIAII
jgi:hypothetical protein